MPLCNSVDWFRLVQQSQDVTLLYRWYDKPAAQGLAIDQKVAINGFRLNASTATVARSHASVCPDIVPRSMVFDAEANPTGVRCTNSDHMVNSIGRDPATGLAYSLLDNVGVQYGLSALESGTISVSQFLDLNEHIGGFDIHGTISPQRAVADPRGVEAAYRTGRVLFTGNGLKDIPVVEIRNYSDEDESASHLKYGTFSALARLIRETGSRENYVVLLESHRNGFMSASASGGDELSRYGLKKMDEWLTAIANNHRPGTKRELVLRNKPDGLVDFCLDKEGNKIVEELTFSGGRCNQTYPTTPSPRMTAGGPMSNDVIKCQLKQPVASDYRVSFTAQEFARLKKYFPMVFVIG